MDVIFKPFDNNLGDIRLAFIGPSEVDKRGIQPPLEQDRLLNPCTSQDVDSGIDAALDRTTEDPVDGEAARNIPAKLESLPDAFPGKISQIRVFAGQDGVPGSVANEQGGTRGVVMLEQMVQ